MYNPHQKPLSRKKTLQLMVAVILAVWATQTFLHQIGYGQTVQARPAADSFVPRATRAASLELRSDATVYGQQVTLRQVARWADADEALFGPIADLALVRLDQPAFRAVSVDEVRQALQAAGVNMAVVQFHGPIACTVCRADGPADQQPSLDQWAQTKQAGTDVVPNGPQAAPAAAQVPPTDLPSVVQAADQAATDSPPVRTGPRTLRDAIVDDLSVRLDVASNVLQLTFSPTDEKLLNLAEPQFQFHLSPKKAKSLGTATYGVQILTGGGAHACTISADARMWQDQVVVAKPLSTRQIVRQDDIEARRVLTDQLPADKLLAPAQVVGQQVTRDLKPGAVMTAKTVEALPLVRAGQFVSITVQQGSVRIKTVARAAESGAYGQTIKVKNETTKEIYEVVVTGPQTAVLGDVQADQSVAAAR